MTLQGFAYTCMLFAYMLQVFSCLCEFIFVDIAVVQWSVYMLQASMTVMHVIVIFTSRVMSEGRNILFQLFQPKI